MAVYTLWQCPAERAIWMASRAKMRKMARGHASFKELIWDPLDCLDHSELENVFMHVWLIWHNRSGFIQEGRIQDPTKLANKAVAYIMEYQGCCRKKHGEQVTQPSC